MQGRNRLRLPDFIHFLAKDGLVEGSNILLAGPPGVGKTVFCENIVKNYLQESSSCLYITLEKTPEELTFCFQTNGVDLHGDGIRDRMVYVDGYTWLIGKSNEKFFIDSLNNLTELNFKIFSAASQLGSPLIVIFNSISPLSLYNPETFVLKSLQLLFARVKEINAIGIFVVQSGVQSQEFYKTLEYLVNGIFDMKLGEDKGSIVRYFRIRSLSSSSHETNWVPFTIHNTREIEMKAARRVENV